MLARNIFSVLLGTTFVLGYSTGTQTSREDLLTRVAEQSRHLAEAGKWDDAKAVLQEQLTKTKDAAEAARLKAELAHLASDRNTYFQKNESSLVAALEEARSAAQAINDKTGARDIGNGRGPIHLLEGAGEIQRLGTTN